MGFSSGPSRGLADLLGHEFLGGSPTGGARGASHDYATHLKFTAAHVLDVSSDSLLGLSDVFQGVEEVLKAREAAAAASASTTTPTTTTAEGVGSSLSKSPESGSAGGGVVGPPRVTLDRASAQGQLQFSQGDTAAEGLNNFSSFRATAACHAGRHMYEATIQTAWQPGIQQIGWATVQCPFTAEEGVGDAPDSYAYGGWSTPFAPMRAPCKTPHARACKTDGSLHSSVLCILGYQGICVMQWISMPPPAPCASMAPPHSTPLSPHLSPHFPPHLQMASACASGTCAVRCTARRGPQGTLSAAASTWTEGRSHSTGVGEGGRCGTHGWKGGGTA